MISRIRDGIWSRPSIIVWYRSIITLLVVVIILKVGGLATNPPLISALDPVLKVAYSRLAYIAIGAEFALLIALVYSRHRRVTPVLCAGMCSGTFLLFGVYRGIRRGMGIVDCPCLGGFFAREKGGAIFESKLSSVIAAYIVISSILAIYLSISARRENKLEI